MDIRALHRQGLTYAEIGRLVGRDWRTVKRYLTEGAQPVYRRQRAPSKLDPLKPVIDQWLAKCPRLLATRIHQDLVRDYGFAGSYQTTRRYVERSRPIDESSGEQGAACQGRSNSGPPSPVEKWATQAGVNVRPRSEARRAQRSAAQRSAAQRARGGQS